MPKRKATEPSTAARVQKKKKTKRPSGSSSRGEPSDKAHDPDLAVECELVRRTAFRELRQALGKRCKTVRAAKGGVNSCFDKWHFAALRLACELSEGLDPLLPLLPVEQQAEAEQVLAAELAADGFGAAAAPIARWFRTAADTAARALSKRLGGVAAASAAGAGGRAAAGVFERPHPSKEGLVEVGVRDASLQLNEGRLRRLRELHGAACGEGASRRDFLCDVVATCLRYQALDGGGFQCALPPPVFECLAQLWGVSCEGFASPLNCHFGAARYFSAFADTDRRFGSLGSFFDGRRDALARGSFELNPPFSAELYGALAARCASLLDAADAAGEPLSFAFVFGATEPALRLPAIRSLRRLPHFTGELVVGVAEHVYLCGRQHIKPRRATFRACDTGVYFLQSRAGAARWPVTPEKLQQLRAAFVATNS